MSKRKTMLKTITTMADKAQTPQERSLANGLLEALAAIDELQTDIALVDKLRGSVNELKASVIIFIIVSGISIAAIAFHLWR